MRTLRFIIFREWTINAQITKNRENAMQIDFNDPFTHKSAEPLFGPDRLARACQKARVFVSMPYVKGVSPRILAAAERCRDDSASTSFERHEGIFELDEIGLSPLDHGSLFGDGVFEDVSLAFGRLFVLQEHLANLYDSARKVSISIPFSEERMARRIVQTVEAAGFAEKDRGRIRITVTRGIGSLDIHPRESLAPTVSIIAFPLENDADSIVEEPTELAVSREVRRQGGDVIDPNIRSCSGLNSILGLLDSAIKGKRDTILVNMQGIVAEATSGHVFFIFRGEGWESNPARATLITPSPEHCLAGIARDLVLLETRRLRFSVREADDMQAIDFAGPDRECFAMSADCSLIPVTRIENRIIGDGRQGPVTEKIAQVIARDKHNPEYGLSITANRDEVTRYIEQPTVYERD